jgi:hypothetical protein
MRTVCASKLFEANGDVRTRRLHRCSDRRSCKNRVGISYNSLQGKQAYLTPHNSFETTLKLLRCGATVIATSRFPHDTAIRFSKVGYLYLYLISIVVLISEL